MQCIIVVVAAPPSVQCSVVTVSPSVQCIIAVFTVSPSVQCIIVVFTPLKRVHKGFRDWSVVPLSSKSNAARVSQSV